MSGKKATLDSSEDICRFCGAHVGYGLDFLHVRICDDHHDIIERASGGPRLLQLMSIKQAIGLEMRGLKRKGGRESAYAIGMKLYKLEGTRKEVQEKLEEMIRVIKQQQTETGE